MISTWQYRTSEGVVMVVTTGHPIAKIAIIGSVIAGLLGGCSNNTPPPALPTSVDQVGEEAKGLGRGIAELGKSTADKLHDVLAQEIPNVEDHFDKLRAESQVLYCAAKAKSAEAAAAVKKEIDKAWNSLLITHPSYRGPKLDLDGTACE